MQTQLININVVDGGVTSPIDPDAPNTALGFLSGSTNIAGLSIPNIAIIVAILITIVIILTIAGYFLLSKQRKHAMRAMWALLLVPAFALIAAVSNSVSDAIAASSLSPLNPITFNITRSNNPTTKTANFQTIVTTDNLTGYTLSAKLDTDQNTTGSLAVGITAMLNMGNLTTTATDIYEDTTGDSPSTLDHELKITVPANIAVGTYQLNIIYAVTENSTSTQRFIQTFGADPINCENLTLHETVRLTDARDGKEYDVRKLDDGNCWMITNLQYAGGGTNTYGDVISLTNNTGAQPPSIWPDDWDALTTSPLFYDPTGQCYDVDQDWNCDPGNGIDLAITPEHMADPGSQFNLGYLYNWCAAMGGQSGVCTDLETEPSGYDETTSICPANWRLPAVIDNSLADINDWTTDVLANPDNEFSNLNARMGGFANNQDSDYLDIYRNYDDVALMDLAANWHPSGPFRGTFSGSWSEGFFDHGVDGVFWSGSRYPAYPENALSTNFGSSYIYPYVSYVYRSTGVSMRCLM